MKKSKLHKLIKKTKKNFLKMRKAIKKANKEIKKFNNALIDLYTPRQNPRYYGRSFDFVYYDEMEERKNGV